jgi:iron complex transport system ATP-binding protein
MGMTAIICAEHLDIAPLDAARDRQPVLTDVSFSLRQGEMVALLGPNGAGKTSLLRCLMGFVRPAGGRVLLDGNSMGDIARTQVARRIAYVPQHHRPIFPFSVQQIVGMGTMAARGWMKGHAEDAENVQTCLEEAGIGHLAKRPYSSLSGGEQQAVLIARALAQRAQALILDEPLASLDLGQRMRLISLFDRLCGEGKCVLATIHEPELARSFFPRALVLKNGRLVADGAGSEVLTPASVRSYFDIPSIF